MGGMWRVPTILIVIYKYIKCAIKIVDSFPLQWLQKLLLEECSPNANKLKRFSFSNYYLKWQVPLCCFFSTIQKFQSAYPWLDSLSNINIQCLHLPTWTLMGLRTGPQIRVSHKCSSMNFQSPKKPKSRNSKVKCYLHST